MADQPFVVVGWRILFHPVFAERYDGLLRDVERLRRRLTDEAFRRHPTAKLLAAVARLVEETVPAEPDRPDFRLSGDLRKFRRAKGFGLPERYRLFWIFSSAAKTIVFLYLNDPATLRKTGSRRDPYVVFAELLRKGKIGPDFAVNLRRWEAARRHRS